MAAADSTAQQHVSASSPRTPHARVCELRVQGGQGLVPKGEVQEGTCQGVGLRQWCAEA